MKPRLLDLFCGAGGAAMGYHRAGFDVVGVDNRPQPNYPFPFIQADALELLSAFVDRGPWPNDVNVDPIEIIDAIHASPPCQAYSDLQKQSKREYPDLIGDTRELLKATGLPYVIENVKGAPLRDPIMLCGSSFGLGVRRHRLFETNFAVMSVPCAHDQADGAYWILRHGRWYLSRYAAVYGTGGGKAKEHWSEAMDIDWMTYGEMAQAIPPAYTELIGTQLRAQLQVAA